MMKHIPLLLIFLSILSCKLDKATKTDKRHNPYEHITQNIADEKAIELYSLGVESFENRDFEEAQKHLKESFAIEKSPITLNELGTISLAKKDYKAALSYFNHGISIDKFYYPNHINKSRTLVLLSEFEKAENTLELMLQDCDSEYWKAYANMWISFINLKGSLNCDKAKESIKKAEFIKNDPDLSQQYGRIKSGIEKNCS
ncbi:tetratricopeptide repeat protein [Sungkyunkwania multivorans]|uniref:Tetratricopeptide repeat protein n=1 Tax=Sungkyunkwania multivorans TaxID=1173618 RepID=A0ABW3CXI3_9FLAO